MLRGQERYPGQPRLLARSQLLAAAPTLAPSHGAGTAFSQFAPALRGYSHGHQMADTGLRQHGAHWFHAPD